LNCFLPPQFTCCEQVSALTRSRNVQGVKQLALLPTNWEGLHLGGSEEDAAV